MIDDVITVRAGQIWRECDPRFERYILVRSMDRGGFAYVSTCDADGVMEDRIRMTKARLSRFNGRRGGYRLVSDG